MRETTDWQSVTESLGDLAFDLVVAKTLDELVKNPDNPIRFRPLDKPQREQFGKHQQAVRQQRDQRQKAEIQVADPSAVRPKSVGETSRAKVKLPKSPIMAPSADRLGKDFAPPKRHEAPQADPKIAPTVRKPRDINKSVPDVPKVLPPKSDPRGDAKGGNSKGGNATGGDSKGGDSKGGNSKGGNPQGGDSQGGGSKGGDSKGKSNDKPKGKGKS